MLESVLSRETLDAKEIGMATRIPTGPFDFGDEATVGLHTKRMGKNIANLDLTKDFGYYLGEHNGMFGINIKEPMGDPSDKNEWFNSIEELKQVWQLD